MSMAVLLLDYGTRANEATNSSYFCKVFWRMIQLLAYKQKTGKCKECNPNVINVKTFHFHTF